MALLTTGRLSDEQFKQFEALTLRVQRVLMELPSPTMRDPSTAGGLLISLFEQLAQKYISSYGDPEIDKLMREILDMRRELRGDYLDGEGETSRT